MRTPRRAFIQLFNGEAPSRQLVPENYSDLLHVGSGISPLMENSLGLYGGGKVNPFARRTYRAASPISRISALGAMSTAL
jgi:hypothetical protein